SRLKPFVRLAKTITEHFDGVVRAMLDNRSNAYVEAMNGLLLQVKRAARGFRTAKNFIAIAHLRMGRLKDLPQSPFKMAEPGNDTGYRHV
ncbi:transposase, partial [Melaminivora jejuensis]